jgi:hypothetical protein
MIFEALPGVYTVLVSVDPLNPDAWKDKRILKVIEILRSKGRPVVLKTQNDSVMFIPDGWDQDRVMRDIKTVLDWKEKMHGSSNIHNRS